jgi:transcriptional regulator with XRE-family HTH domain
MSNSFDSQPNWQGLAFGHRLKLALGRKSTSEFADQLGLSRSGIHKNLAGTIPRGDVLHQMARILGVDAEWLISGPNTVEPIFCDRLFLLPIEGAAQPTDFSVRERIAGTVRSVNKAMLLGSIKRQSPEGLFWADAQGDSMHPLISNNALCVIDAYDTRLADGVFIFQANGQKRIRRFHLRFTGQMTMKAENAFYPDEMLSHQEANDLPVLGRVIWVGQAL